jgi:cytochrome c biogenesis protein CcdA
MDIFISFGSALWFGILTSISPCPLATNIAAVSFLSKKVNDPLSVLFSSMAYILGRMITYSIIGTVVIFSLLSIPGTANFLQLYMNKVLGPVLILVGLFLVDALNFKTFKISISQERQNMLADSGIVGSFLLGMLFALSFCPIAAALFFGSLIPLALNSKFGMIHPFIYGFGSGIPVALFSLAIVLGVKSFSKWLKNTARIEFITRKLTGIIFIIVGIYFIWSHLVANLFN